ncbi:MAG TPA: hypothetical protein VGG30_08120 [Pirellulales bacterium]|jgi:hypothetical protein
MGSRKSSSDRRATEHAEARAAGWPELHVALQAGIPHAVDIVATLDAHGFSYPWSPAFSSEHAELPCYRVVHQAWREGLLSELLRVLAAWRTVDNQLPRGARRPELQQALCEFLAVNPEINSQTLRICLSGHSLSELMPEVEASTVESIRTRIEVAWNARWC